MVHSHSICIVQAGLYTKKSRAFKQLYRWPGVIAFAVNGFSASNKLGTRFSTTEIWILELTGRVALGYF